MSNTSEGLAKYREKVASGEIVVKTRNPQERHEDDPKSKVKAIHAKCWDCSCFQREEIRHCTMTDCSLYAFRPYK